MSNQRLSAAVPVAASALSGTYGRGRLHEAPRGSRANPWHSSSVGELGSERDAAVAIGGLGSQYLVHLPEIAFETDRGGSHVKAPHSGPTFSGFLHRAGPVRFEVLHPPT